MQINVDAAWALAVFYVWLRLSCVFLLAPVPMVQGTPAVVRVLFTLALAALLVTGGGVRPALPSFSAGQVLLGAIGEMVVGLTLAFGVFAAFGAFAMAGKILDVQSGFGLGVVYDPVTRAGAPMFATILNMTGVALFFALDGHHALLRGLAFSLRRSAPGAGLELSADAAVAQFGLVFSYGIALIIPVILCLLLLELALAVASRTLPQMNVFVVSIPLKLVAALVVFAISAPTLGPAMERIYRSIFTYWESVLG
jgi:flagellar biosynthesis protein FliR